MNATTQLSLLQRLKQNESNNDLDWSRFVHIYTPLLLHWAHKVGVPTSDRLDVVQTTFVKLLSSIDRYQVQEHGSFRSWLFVVLKNTSRDFFRKNQTLPAVAAVEIQEAVESNEVDRLSELEHRQYLMRRIHQLVLADFPLSSQQAFQWYVVEGQPVEAVAEKTGMTVNSVYLVRSRILKRLREELAGLCE
jgi:RNA polymerase sigma-70 factor, ECF subfamily